ncbi:RNA polymerase sigma factor [Ammoniphilus sp. CFH 90114]|uniref:RNA polymerase sigma factor n=1 Tax=Ammoniphilus sp. CFH 90114 TaxID=2493665 RepID=UPI00100E3C46|nr:sigma-70 family RNA polymerase sigma factor [Ammoniphilus sp. CFH 90114]RXT14803.1 sigma-70 family RNA polymerase sigma factor [Ammoniphilus sp. CFH 90114]
MTEADLVRAAQAGDRDALIQLLRMIEKSVYKTAYYILKNEQEAMDAAQEALIKVYNKIDTYQEKAKFSTWVQRIVTNICIDLCRKRKETTSIDEHPLPLQDKANVEEEVQLTYMAKDIREAINLLPEQHRTVIVMRYIQDFSYTEIAEALELPLNTVKSHLFRARQQLQKQLLEYQKGGVRV